MSELHHVFYSASSSFPGKSEKGDPSEFFACPGCRHFFFLRFCFLCVLHGDFLFFLSNYPSLLPSVINEVIKILDECTT